MACRRVCGWLVQQFGPINATDCPEEDKYRRESLAIDYLCCLLKASNPSAATEIKSLFEEFEEGRTPEAKLVGEIDAFECLVQAEEYEERAHGHHRLHEFIDLESYISSADLSRWTRLLAQERSAISSKRSTDTTIIFVIGKYGLCVDYFMTV
jgi:5'-deoxynucleotidase YfbR-like HD superfamily hydrolase